MRCSRPGVPGTAHGRARVAGSRCRGGSRAASVRPGTADVGQVVDVGHPPRLGAGGQEGVGQVDDRGHVLEGDADGLEGDRRSTRPAWPGRRPGSASRRCARTGPGAGRPARSWSACRSTGRPAGRRSTTRGSSTITARFIASHFRAMPGSRRAGQAQRAAVARPDRRADGGDLVLGLERLDPEVLVARELVEDVAGRGDRVRAVEQRPVGLLAGDHEAQGGRLVAGDVAVRAGRQVGRRRPGSVVWNISVVSPKA